MEDEQTKIANSQTAAGHETADKNCVLEFSVPDHGVAGRIAVILDHRIIGNLDPFPVYRDIIVARPHVVVCAMAICDVAAKSTVL